jgi:hypothetical protein
MALARGDKLKAEPSRVSALQRPLHPVGSPPVPIHGGTTMQPCLCLSLLLSGLASAAAPAPAVPDSSTQERLARSDPVAFVTNCLRRYQREVQSYRAVLRKQERIDGQLRRSEELDVSFREKPFSVLLIWRRNPGRAERVLYVEGENDNQLLVRPSGFAYRVVGIVRRDPRSADAQQAGRVPLTDFGMGRGTERLLASWRAAEAEGKLHVEYLGKKVIPEAGNRTCYVLRRTGFSEDRARVITVYFDAETWLQVGTTLKGEDNALLGEYFFRDVRINPDLPEETFTRAAMEK